MRKEHMIFFVIVVGIIAGILGIRFLTPDNFKYIHHITIGIDSIIALALFMVLLSSSGGGGDAVAVYTGMAIILIAMFFWGIFSTFISFLYYPITQSPQILWYAWIKVVIVIGAPLLSYHWENIDNYIYHVKYARTIAGAARNKDPIALQKAIDRGESNSQRWLIEIIIEQGMDDDFVRQLLKTNYKPRWNDLHAAVKHNRPVWKEVMEYKIQLNNARYEEILKEEPWSEEDKKSILSDQQEQNLRWKKIAVKAAVEFDNQQVLQQLLADDSVLIPAFISAAVFSKVDLLEELYQQIPQSKSKDIIQEALHEAATAYRTSREETKPVLDFLIGKGAPPQKETLKAVVERGWKNDEILRTIINANPEPELALSSYPRDSKINADLIHKLFSLDYDKHQIHEKWRYNYVVVRTPELLKVMIADDFNLNSKDGKSLIESVIHAENIDCLKLLADHGADFSGRKPYANFYNSVTSPDVVMFLLERGLGIGEYAHFFSDKAFRNIISQTPTSELNSHLELIFSKVEKDEYIQSGISETISEAVKLVNDPIRMKVIMGFLLNTGNDPIGWKYEQITSGIMAHTLFGDSDNIEYDIFNKSLSRCDDKHKEWFKRAALDSVINNFEGSKRISIMHHLVKLGAAPSNKSIRFALKTVPVDKIDREFLEKVISLKGVDWFNNEIVLNNADKVVGDILNCGESIDRHNFLESVLSSGNPDAFKLILHKKKNLWPWIISTMAYRIDCLTHNAGEIIIEMLERKLISLEELFTNCRFNNLNPEDLTITLDYLETRADFDDKYRGWFFNKIIKVDKEFHMINTMVKRGYLDYLPDNDTHNMPHLADALESGVVIPKDQELANKYHKLSQEIPYNTALWLIELEQTNQERPKGYDYAHYYILEAAENGLVEAMLHIGKLYRDGVINKDRKITLEPDNKKSQFWLEKAAAGGSEEAKKELENMRQPK